ncbi:unnamed protein product [Phytomonas sp. Hart1]|nr:unnamed protein product [Phytomonas sp. Hart1]|eukprot:CCW67712.1 unnamed protein product [Phytomonas sp. isolate Hart1]
MSSEIFEVDDARPLFARKISLIRLTEYQARLICEGIGTFIFLMTIVLAEMNCGVSAIDNIYHNHNLAPIAEGLIISGLIFTFGYISGGHFNPAVTSSALILGEMRIDETLAFWSAQVIGAILGASCGVFISGKTHPLPAPQIYYNAPEYVLVTLIFEGVFTCFLVSVLLNIVHSKNSNEHYYGLTVGICLMALYYAVGGVSKGAFNPAVATALQLTKFVMAGYASPLMFLWIYWMGPVLGAVLATILFKITHPVPTKSEESKPEEKTARNLYS